MTAKEALHEAVEAMDESEAERWLGMVRGSETDAPTPQEILNAPTIAELAEAAFRDVPDEVWAKVPSSDRIDEVLRQHGRNSFRA